MSARSAIRKVGLWVSFAALGALAPTSAHAQAWDAVPYFQYAIENVAVSDLGAGTWNIRVVFAVLDPTNGSAWNIKAASPFQFADPLAIPATSATLNLDIGWDPAEFTNTGSEFPAVAAITTAALGKGAAMVIQVRDLHKAASHPCTGPADCPGATSYVNRYWVDKTVTPRAFRKPVTMGRVAIEGRPVCNGLAVCASTPNANIPVTSATADFSFQPADPQHAMVANQRRTVVDIAKCKACHDGTQHGQGVVPRLSLHGGNRNENLNLCVMCHNPNQTDVPYRYSGLDRATGRPEVPVDLKTMVHSIHAGGFRKTPFVVIGRNSSVNDFSHVRFPNELRNCLNCHVEVNGRGTYELPLQAGVLGTTIKTRSVYRVPLGATRTIDVDPANDIKISPTAAACSACHDKAEVRSHMIRTGGASFSKTQSAIGTTVVERCVTCHGPGKEEDVKKAHEVGRSGSGGGDEHED